MLVRAAVAFVLFLLLGYGALEAWPLLTGPSLAIESPNHLAYLTDGSARITGRAARTETLWLDGAPLLIDEKGNFAANLLLPSGGAILSLTATDRFGNEITERRTVFVP